MRLRGRMSSERYVECSLKGRNGKRHGRGRGKEDDCWMRGRKSFERNKECDDKRRMEDEGRYRERKGVEKRKRKIISEERDMGN